MTSKHDDRPYAARLENYGLLLAEHCLTASPRTIGMAWIEWGAFVERRRSQAAREQHYANLLREATLKNFIIVRPADGTDEASGI
jgi:hypothetical protein